MLSRLKHENIVKYFGMERTDDRLNLLMEYVAGGTISSLVNRYGKFKESLIKSYVL